MISAFSFRSRTAARRTVQTLIGSKVALRHEHPATVTPAPPVLGRRRGPRRRRSVRTWPWARRSILAGLPPGLTRRRRAGAPGVQAAGYEPSTRTVSVLGAQTVEGDRDGLVGPPPSKSTKNM